MSNQEETLAIIHLTLLYSHIADNTPIKDNATTGCATLFATNPYVRAAIIACALQPTVADQWFVYDTLFDPANPKTKARMKAVLDSACANPPSPHDACVQRTMRLFDHLRDLTDDEHRNEFTAAAMFLAWITEDCETLLTKTDELDDDWPTPNLARIVLFALHKDECIH